MSGHEKLQNPATFNTDQWPRIKSGLVKPTMHKPEPEEDIVALEKRAEETCGSVEKDAHAAGIPPSTLHRAMMLECIEMSKRIRERLGLPVR